MALHGSIDEFDVEAVLRLLEHAGSVGVLHIEGADHAASIWVRKGSCLWARTDLRRDALAPEEAVVDAVFELSLLEGGLFRFNGCATGDLKPPASAPRRLRDVLKEVGERRAEWSKTVSDLPRPESTVEFAAGELAGDVVVRPEEWRLLALIDGSRTVRQLLASGDGLWRTGNVLVSLLGAGLVRVAEAVRESPVNEPLDPELVDELSALGADDTPLQVESVDEEPDVVVITASGPDDEAEAELEVRRLAGEALRDLSSAEGEETAPKGRFLRLLSGDR